jgi:alpha-tubulin suppressor-like RCC1 family protein
MRVVCWPVATLLLVPLATGCDSPTDTDLPPKQIDIGGVWDFTDSLIVSSEVIVCQDTGSLRFEQSGDTFTGRGGQVGRCKGILGEYASDRILEIEDGQITDSTISFRVLDVCGCAFGECLDAVFLGTVHSDGSIVGSNGCSVKAEGSWNAGSPAAVASIEFPLDSIQLVVDEVAHVAVTLRSATGARLFQRPVSWSSSSARILQISDSGWIRAIEPGVATVTAEVGDLSSDYTVRSRQVEFVSVEAGVYHTCGLDLDGTVFCWGANEAGQSGPEASLAPCSDSRAPCQSAPSEIPSTVPMRQVSPGFLTTCALAETGSAHCWGINDVGQLGIDLATRLSPIPVAVSGGLTFTSLRTGTNHTCGITPAGIAHCWGYNNHSQLGFAGAAYSWSPVSVAGGLTYGIVVTGQEHSCGIATADNRTYCWGWNYYGQLGVDSILTAYMPQPVSGGLTFTSIESGQEHSCGLTDAGTAYCWGRDRENQLGAAPGEFDDVQITPVPVLGGLTFQSLSAGGFHTCGLTPSGAAYCWGRGDLGQLGNGSYTDSSEPAAVVGGLSYQSISAGYLHTCGLTDDGAVYCWGSNNTGQLGTQTGDRSEPTMVIGQRK